MNYLKLLVIVLIFITASAVEAHDCESGLTRSQLMEIENQRKYENFRYLFEMGALRAQQARDARKMRELIIIENKRYKR